MISLNQLARAVNATVVGGKPAAREVSVVAVVHDTRKVKRGALFACIPGTEHDGHDFVRQAVRQGAVAVLVEAPVTVPVPNLVVPSVRAALGPAAAELYGHPSRHLDLIGVTGTNGKTTTVQLLAEILNATDHPCGKIGTLTGVGTTTEAAENPCTTPETTENSCTTPEDAENPGTTPEATEIQCLLSKSINDGKKAVAMEVSSHGLDQRRVDGCRFRVAVFTNFGRDHLDYHKTLKAYWKAKARLFTPALSDQAVVWTGTAAGEKMSIESKVPVTEVGPDDVKVLKLKPASSRFRWRNKKVEIPLGGRVNVYNAVLAAETAVVLGVDPKEVAAALNAANSEPELFKVPGRFEIVDEGQNFTVVVDYAHTPDALEAVLKSARDCTKNRLWVVFGAGGDRDRGKRPEMGAVAEAAADRVVVTSDNPRKENRKKIIDAIVSGMDPSYDYQEEICREEAIRLAIDTARAGDLIVIAGKGHETEPFDDREVARKALRARMARER